MSNADNKQIGGLHYKHFEYEHWNFATDILHSDAYLKGCCSKYIARYRFKNGMEDLQKAKHYLEKIIELNIKTEITKETSLYLTVFTDQLEYYEKLIIKNIYLNKFDIAMDNLNKLIEQYEYEIANSEFYKG